MLPLNWQQSFEVEVVQMSSNGGIVTSSNMVTIFGNIPPVLRFGFGSVSVQFQFGAAGQKKWHLNIFDCNFFFPFLIWFLFSVGFSLPKGKVTEILKLRSSSLASLQWEASQRAAVQERGNAVSWRFSFVIVVVVVVVVVAFVRSSKSVWRFGPFFFCQLRRPSRPFWRSFVLNVELGEWQRGGFTKRTTRSVTIRTRCDWRRSWTSTETFTPWWRTITWRHTSAAANQIRIMCCANPACVRSPPAWSGQRRPSPVASSVRSAITCRATWRRTRRRHLATFRPLRIGRNDLPADQR